MLDRTKRSRIHARSGIRKYHGGASRSAFIWKSLNWLQCELCAAKRQMHSFELLIRWRKYGERRVAAAAVAAVTIADKNLNSVIGTRAYTYFELQFDTKISHARPEYLWPQYVFVIFNPVYFSRSLFLFFFSFREAKSRSARSLKY